MKNQYHFTLVLDCPDGKTYRSAFDLAAASAPQFKPYDLCSDPRTAAIYGGVIAQEATRINEDRETLAEQIAIKLTETILNALKSQDLRDGYKQTVN